MNLKEPGFQKALKSIQLFPEQCFQAWNDCSKLEIPEGYSDIKNVIVSGMGGSRFTPLSIKECFRDKIKVPYEICDEYFLPNYVDSDSLVILSSYSGTTEEVLSCALEAEQKKAKIAIISSGGNLLEIANEKKYFSYIFEEKYNPSKQPRFGVGYMLFGHLGILSKIGLIDVDEEDISNSIENSRNFAFESEAKDLADKMKDKEVTIVTSEHLRGFANGFANQINENAKAISTFRYISELNHHFMEGLANPSDLKSRWLYIFIKSKLFDERILRRYEITKDVFEKQNIEILEHSLTGKSKLSDLLEAFLFSGYSSLYLSAIYKVDPSKIPWVDYFKESLSQPVH